MIGDTQVATQVLSGRVLNRNAKGGTPGTRFVQRSDTAKLAKRASRLRMLALFGQEGLEGHLQFLTFPSTNWIFEGMLINNRCGNNKWKYGRHPIGWHTMIVGIEREESIYRTALRFIPTAKYGFRAKGQPEYATTSIRTFAIKRYLQCDFETLAQSPTAVDCKGFKFNGAWLDFNGCINLRRKEAIEAFLRNHTDGRCRLAITTANCRYDAESNEFWGNKKLDTITSWLQSLGGKLLYKTQYQSTIPMIEVAMQFFREDKEEKGGDTRWNGDTS